MRDMLLQHVNASKLQDAISNDERPGCDLYRTLEIGGEFKSLGNSSISGSIWPDVVRGWGCRTPA